MTLKRRSARAMMALLVIMILAAFALLSLRNTADGKYDFIALPFGALVCFYMVFSAGMYAKAFRHFDKLTLYIAYFLIAVGLIVLYRINTAYAMRQFIMVLGGSLIMLIVIKFIRSTKDFGRFNWLFMVLTLGLMASTLALGRVVGGARNWLSIGGITVQPSELCKVFFIIISAYFLSTRHNLRAFIPYLCFTAGCVIILVAAKDLGAGLLFAGTFLLMFYAATGRKLLTLGGLGVLAVGAVGSYKLFSHVRTRVEVWRDPWSVYQDQGYQIVQGLIALASGGLFGVGLGQGMPQVIPAAQTDYIFAVIGEEFGIIIGIMIVAFYLLLIVRGILIAINARSTFDALLVFGATIMLALQSFIIIGGVIKLIPLTGITLPFVSYGGSSMVVSLMQMGIIQGVAIKNGQADEAEIEMMGGMIL